MASIIRIKATGAFRAQVRRTGFTPQTATFPTREQAARWARDVEHKIDKGRDPGAGAHITISECIALFRRERTRPLSSTRKAILGNLERGLGERRAARLTTAELVDFCKKRLQLDGVSPATTLADMSLLGCVISHVNARHRLGLPEIVRLSLKHLRSERLVYSARSRERRPEESELKQLLLALPSEFKDVLRFAIATAMRRSEIARLRWSDVVERDRCIWVRERKHPTDKERNDGLVPLLGKAWDILQRQPRQPGEDRIFPFHPKAYSSAFREACVKCNITGLRAHDMRHEAISRLFEAGLEIPQVQLVSGHRTWDNLRRYTNLRPADLHKHALPERESVVA